MRIECNPPIVGENPKVLILGSMPGAESLKQKQYFAYKGNRFWRLMFCCFNQPFSEDYDVRQQLLKDNKIALWDTIQSCFRSGSLDSNIKDEKPVALVEFLNEYPSIKIIILNGKKAQAVFKKYFKNIPIKTVCLPSTSPSNIACCFEKLYEVWQAALACF